MKTKTLLFLLAASWYAAGIQAQTVDKRFYTTDGNVHASLQTGNTVYIGGDFTKLGIQANAIARINNGTAKPDITFPQFDRNSQVYAAEADGSGGFYVAGYLYNFNGTALPPGTQVIHILNNGTLDNTFIPVTTNSQISALKKKNNVLYIGGYFTTINTDNRQYLGAVDATTGTVTSWNPPDAPNSAPTQIEAGDTSVFIDGIYSLGNYSLGGSYFAPLSANTGKFIRNFSSFNGQVTAMTVDNNTLYVAGSFSSAGTSAQGIAKFNPATNNHDVNFPSTNGYIYASLPDGIGGWYIGGSFTTIANISRNNLAHILFDGSVDPAFNVNVNTNVSCLTTDGTNLYFGGNFTTVNGISRPYGAAVSLSNGTLQPWNPSANSSIYCMTYTSGNIYMGGAFTTIKGSNRNYAAAVSTGNSSVSWTPNPNSYVRSIIANTTGTFIYLGGDFTTVKGATRNYLAKVDAAAGNLNSWNPNPNSSLYSMVLNGNNLYIGGYFTAVKTTYNRQYFAAVDTSTAIPSALIADANNLIETMTINGTNLYIGGYFTTIQNQNRNYLARIDLTGGNVDSWSPQPDNDITTISITGSNVFAGGEFSFVNNTPRARLASVDLSTNLLTAWNPQVAISTGPSKILHHGSDVIAGGSFYYNDGTNQINFIVALNDATGNISHNFMQYPDGGITDMTIANNSLVLAGSFSSFYDINTTQYTNRRYMADYSLSNYQLSNSIYEPDTYTYQGGGNMLADGSGNLIVANTGFLWNTVLRGKLAAVDITTGIPTSWNPSANGGVYALAIKDSIIYAGGQFSIIGGQSRAFLAAVSANTGLAKNWNWDANSYVYTLGVQDSTLFVGGSFTTIKGNNRNYAAAISTTGNGSLKAWNPGPNSYVLTLQTLPSASGGDIYLGGYFSTVKGATRNYLARVNNSNGNLITSFNPNPDNYISCLAFQNNTLYAGGQGFTTISGQSRNALAAYDINTNALKLFNADLKYSGNNSAYLNSLAINGKEVFIGADFLDSLKGSSRGHLAAADTATAAATSFNPLPDGSVYNISVGSNKLYAGGNWFNINGVTAPSYFAVYTLQPQTQASTLNFTNLQPQSLTANWTNGSGEARIAVAKLGATPNTPDDGKSYNSNSVFGSGQSTGTQSYALANGIGSNVNVTNLLPNHSYNFSVFEYNGTGAAADYLQSPALTGNVTTPCPTYNVTASASGPLTFCSGDSVLLTAPTGFSSYLWSNGSSVSQIKVTASGNYSVTAVDSNSCNAITPALTVTANPLPSTPVITPSGATTFCQGGSITLTASAAASYLWSTGATTQVIVVSTSGNYSVTISNANGCSASSEVTVVTVNSLPAAPTISFSGSTTLLCPGKTVPLICSAATSYLWNTGAITQSIVVSTPGSYTVKVTNANGCQSLSSVPVVVTYNTCAKPTGLIASNVTGSGVKLSWTAVTCAVGYQYEWRVKGTTLYTVGQTTGITKILTGLLPATTYQWRVITACKISPDTITSAGYTNGAEFITLAAAFAIGDDNKQLDLKATNNVVAISATVSPNPASNMTTVKILNANGAVQVILTDLSGRQIWQSAKTKNLSIPINVTGLAQGTYMILIKDEVTSKTMKLIKE